MSTPHNDQALGKPLGSKKKRSAVFIVIVASIAVHILAGLGLAAIKIIEVLQPEPEFEAPPVVENKPPPPPPPPPPTNKRAQRSLPRPQPLAARNPQNMSVPAIEINNSDLAIGGGRGFGGGLGALGGAVADSIRISSFGFDQAMEGTLEGTLYDFKKDAKGKGLKSVKGSRAMVSYASGILKSFTGNFRRDALNRKFFKSETLLYGAYFIIPNTSAKVAPRAFKAEGVIDPSLICAVYTGTYRPTKSGRFRLFGRADDVLIVRINGKTVLDGSYSNSAYSRWNQPASAKRADEENPQSYFRIPLPGVSGNWFDLTAGRETQVEIVIAEVPGGKFGAYILIEEEGQPGKQIFTTRPLGDKDKEFLKKSHPDAAQFIK